MNITKKHIDEIRPYWRNPRKNEKAVEAVKESIKQFGYNSPIVVDKKGVIIAGHTRYKALRQLGYEDINVIVLEISEDKAKQYRIADNKTQEKAEWDTDLLTFELREIEELGDMKLFFNPGELDKFFETEAMKDITTFSAADYTATEDTIRTAVVEEFNESPTESNKEDYDRRVREETERLMRERERQIAIAENERMRQRMEELEAENAKIKEEEAKMNSVFTDRSDDRSQDLIKVTCPHCSESMMLSKGELLRKDKFENA